MARFDHLKGVFGLLPTPYTEDYEILTADLRRAADQPISQGRHQETAGDDFQIVAVNERKAD